MEHHYKQAAGIRLHYVEEGAGPPVVLLHGFPDFWYSWRHQIPVLAAAGFRVIAPDLRGYNLSERPGGVAKYTLDELSNDVAALVRELGVEPPVIIGHDWGGIIGWHLAMHRVGVARALIVLNAPHPAAYKRELKQLSSQILRSWYAALFQIPKVPEAMLSAFGFAILRRALRSGPAESDEDVERYLAALSAPGSLTAALNYYRAAVRYPPTAAESIELPTLLLWGMRDPFLVPRLTEGLDPWVKHLEVVRLADAGHWLHHSHAEDVNHYILSFIRRYCSTAN